MKDFSKFIHEEIFMIKDSEPSKKMSSVKPSSESPTMQNNKNYKLGIIGDAPSVEDQEQLDKILGALQISNEEKVNANSAKKDLCNKWLIFSDDYQVNNTPINHYTIFNQEGVSYILAHPLSSLRNSNEQKQQLWNTLKELFGL